MALHVRVGDASAQSADAVPRSISGRVIGTAKQHPSINY
jgi:hypothetical protein